MSDAESDNSIAFSAMLNEILQDEIKEKDAEIERLRAALQPFANSVGSVRSRAYYRAVPLAWLKDAQAALAGKV